MSINRKQIEALSALWARSYQTQLPAATIDAIVPLGVAGPASGAPIFARVLRFLIDTGPLSLTSVSSLLTNTLQNLTGVVPPVSPGGTQFETNAKEADTATLAVRSALDNAMAQLEPGSVSQPALPQAFAVETNCDPAAFGALRAAVDGWAGGEVVATTYAAWASVNAPAYPTAAQAPIAVLAAYITSEVA